MNDSIEERVARGAEWLDATKPGWERLVDLAELDLSSSCRCVLGQVFARLVDRNAGVEDGFDAAMGFMAEDVAYDVDGPARFGFDALNDSAYSVDWRALDEAWIGLLKERFDSGALSDNPS